MAALHDALKTLSPTTVDALPSPEDLSGYMANALRDTHILVNSLPTPSNTPCNVPSDPSFESLHKEWKPVKLGAKENPLGFSVYRLAAKDGKGTWFARRSVHEEVGFRKFRAGLAREFECGAERGNSIRGVGREKQVEKSRCRLGQAEVNYLTAQFPGPSAPRDFVTTTLTSSAHPEDLFPSGEVPSSPSHKPKPRQFTMISRPLTDHPECPERQGYVRGQFESIEFIREIPSICNPPINRRPTQTEEELRRVKSVPSIPSLQDDREGDGEGEMGGESERAGRGRGRTITFADNDAVPEGLKGPTHPHPKENPVEWIMITRSDPGGSVPRWMVERGTPGGIVKDAEKFLDWAVGKTDLEDGYPEDEDDEEMAEGSKVGRADQLQAQEEKDISNQEPAHGPHGPQDVLENRQPMSETPQDAGGKHHGGFISSAVSAVSAGVSMITPSVMSSSSTTSDKDTPTTSMVAHDELLTPPATTPGATTPDTETEIDDTASMNSFATAPSPENDTTSVNSTSTSAAPISTPEEKALARLLREKVKLAEKLERQRSRERKKRSKEDEREQKLLEKHMKEVEKREARYNKDIEKARRREEKRKAKELSKEQKEVIELKKVVEGLTKENLALREKVELLEGRERLRSAEEAVGVN